MLGRGQTSYLLAACLIGSCLATLSWFMTPGMPPGGFIIDGDTAMRLVRLTDSLAAGTALHSVMRDSSGQGTMLHWTHLIDALVLAVASPVAAVAGWHAGLLWAAAVFGPLCMGALAASIVWAIKPLAVTGVNEPPCPLWLSAVALGLAPTIQSYGSVGVIHHHIPILVTGALAAGCVVRSLIQPSVSTGIGTGLWIAVGVWFSPEALMPGLIALGVVWVAWLQRPSSDLGRTLAVAGATLFGGLALTLLLDPPAFGLLSVEPDRLSIMYVALGAGAAIAGAAALRVSRLGAALVVAAIIVAWCVAFPELLRGTAGLMTRSEARVFFEGISEMAPVDSVELGLAALGAGSLATILIAFLGWQQRSLPLIWLAVCGVATIGLSTHHLRFSAYPAALAAATLPLALSFISRSHLPDRLAQWVRLGTIAAALGFPALADLGTATAQEVTIDTTGLQDPGCLIDDAVTLIAPLGRGVVLAQVNLNPTLLWRTPATTVGTLFHRGVAGYLRLHTAWLDATDPEAAVRLTGAEAVLVCARPGQTAPAGSLADQLIRRAVPPWLTQMGSAGGYVLYQVRR